MKIVALTLAMGLLGLSGCSSSTGAELCVAAGGQCVLGGHVCANAGPQDCNPDRNPGGAFCCLPCPAGTKANDAGTACQ
ncbi:MAG TPA: hypothetical protein VKZ18_14835 [Polyangia bacterium]|nr:hypothetical protein [Polyangia bacterium]